MNIAVITPVSHLDGVIELLVTKGTLFCFEEATKDQVRELLLTQKIDTILCNPNQQTYKIDKELLEGTTVSLINTCSTGMNHIDVEYCNKNNIEIYSLTKDMELINDLPSTSELAFGLMMSLLRKIPQSKNHVSEYKCAGRSVNSTLLSNAIFNTSSLSDETIISGLYLLCLA